MQLLLQPKTGSYSTRAPAWSPLLTRASRPAWISVQHAQATHVFLGKLVMPRAWEKGPGVLSFGSALCKLGDTTSLLCASVSLTHRQLDAALCQPKHWPLSS